MNGQTQTKAFVPLPGGTQVKYAGSAISTYRLPDWLGSFRVGSNPNRTYSWGVAFAPFGEMYAQSGVPAWSFTGEEGTADTVSDEYDFLNRKLHSAQGRWISPDPAGLGATDPMNPQSWNRYAYVLNNPLSLIDTDGLWCVWDDGSGHDDPGNGGFGKDGCISQGGHWDPFDTISNIWQQNGEISRIDYSNGVTCTTANCGAGGTLEALDQGLKSYSVLSSTPNWAWSFTTSFFGHFSINLNSGSCLDVALSAYQPLAKGAEDVKKWGEKIAPIATILPALGNQLEMSARGAILGWFRKELIQ